MKRGDVYLADLEPRSGSEPTGRRPVLVVSHDSFNRTPGWRSAVALCHQVTTLDRTKLDRRLGSLSPKMLAVVESGLKASLGLR